MDFKLFIEQIKKFYNSMSKQQRIVLFSSLGVLLAGLIFIFAMASRVSYAPLFTNLNAKDAADIVSYLNQHGIKYKLENGGSVIEVPKDMVYSLRLDLVAAGLPKHGVVGFEIFDKQNFGTTPFVENINYIRALEGELTRTIENIAEVKSARVNIAIPKPTIFTERQQPPTASIVLDLYRPLSRDQILAIQRLVAAAVPGLSYKDVTIVDSEGNLLSINSSQEQLLTANELKYKQIVEQQYTQRIKNLLQPILGKDKFVVSVNVDLDLSRVKKKSITYDPNSVVVSEESEESSTTTPVNGGVPGVISNIGNNTTTQSQVSKSSKSKTITNYDVGRTETLTEEPLIKIKSVSAAVVVDGMYEPIKNKKGKITGYKFKPLPQSEIAAIQQAVMSAIGYNKNRGDKVTVTCMKFASTKGGNMGNSILGGGNMVINVASYYKYALVALLLALFYFLFLRRFIKNVMTASLPKVEKEEEMKAEEGKETEEIEEEKVKGKTIKEIEEEIASKLEEEEVVDEEKIRSSMMEEKIREAAQQNPEEVASLIKTLLASKPKG
ncbi:flagellar basal-body MS-ring/collar protein FliF [Hippea alviniae]|uniref:flagellar basal-body MS-ring/collar protein FliF n=1 Tax=Hippea alviniae TaxID=1279027 RepID=UPI0003B64BE6|nr:flagellar basal-body MS-ring/collar protein FliF [Hippea alviniae]